METKKFQKNDNSFVCRNCGCFVDKLNTSSRDHCNQCLHSIHVDINPGDRSNDCLGDLVPIGVEIGKKGYMIVYRCAKCGAIKKNRAAEDDNFDKIIELSTGKY